MLYEVITAKLVFETGDGDAQGRLADGTVFRGAAEIPLLGECNDVTQFSQGHACFLLSTPDHTPMIDRGFLWLL